MPFFGGLGFLQGRFKDTLIYNIWNDKEYLDSLNLFDNKKSNSLLLGLVRVNPFPPDPLHL